MEKNSMTEFGLGWEENFCCFVLNLANIFLNNTSDLEFAYTTIYDNFIRELLMCLLIHS